MCGGEGHSSISVDGRRVRLSEDFAPRAQDMTPLPPRQPDYYESGPDLLAFGIVAVLILLLACGASLVVGLYVWIRL